MIVVGDSSPFVVLIKIGHIGVLPLLFNEILIPPQVALELGSLRRPDEVRAFMASEPSWLRIVAPTSIELIPGLHPGETAAITLAKETYADRLIMDEYSGRKAAVERGLRVVGTVGLLELAAERGLLELKDAFERVKQTDFWVSHSLLDQRLALFHQRRQNFKPAD